MSHLYFATLYCDPLQSMHEYLITILGEESHLNVARYVYKRIWCTKKCTRAYCHL